MTPERRRRVDELFAGALRVDPRERQTWLATACGGDEGLRSEVTRLLERGEGVTRDEAPTTSQSSGGVHGPTESWHPRGRHRTPRGRQPREGSSEKAFGEVSGFSPRPVIATGPRPRSVTEAESAVRARLRELPMIHILILAMACFWRCTILGDDDPVLRGLDASAIAFLIGVLIVLWSRLRLRLASLRALELTMITVLATRLGIVEYRLVLALSRRGDWMMAQFIVKNVILLIAVLIPSYGLYVPKTWRRAALVVGPLALLPFAILGILYIRQPDAMAWLVRGRTPGATPRFLLFSFDALLLLILAIACSAGARAISLLRRQVAEARQLGQYRLGRRIGAGGMGEVYLAEHQLLKRPCALKLIRPDSVADPRSLARFEREVCLTAVLSHPNTVEIYDYGRTEDGTYYYVMEYLPGLSLAELVERYGPQPPERVVYLLLQVCQALSEAHAAGLIHRDIKPSNILVSRRGGRDDVAKVLDFGLVLPMAHTGAPQMSGEGEILGTPLFMSPEQAEGYADIDGRSDIYSLGAVAYYLLTGRPPFDQEDGIQVLIAHARDPVVPPSLVRDSIPDDVDRVVVRCLAKAPGDRFPDAKALEAALSACACANEWDQDRAARWWQSSDRAQGRA